MYGLSLKEASLLSGRALICVYSCDIWNVLNYIHLNALNRQNKCMETHLDNTVISITLVETLISCLVERFLSLTDEDINLLWK